ncbi:4'-phosphopantetheinyl transferase superfamily protein [Streptomyces sp. NPDC054933]
MNTTEILTRTAPSAVHSAGVDLVDLDRWDRAVKRCGPRLLHRLFADSELAAAERAAADTVIAPTQVLGYLFGVKESVVKAVGGLPPGSGFTDVRVQLPAGDPTETSWPVALDGELVEWARCRDVALVGGAAPLADGMALAWAVARPCDGTR